MKNIKYIVAALLCIFILPGSVNAASGNISVTSSSTIVLGNTVTVTVKLSSSVAIGSWEMNLSYDKSYLELTSSTGEAGGVGMVNSSAGVSGITSKTYTFKFRTLKTGSTKVSVSSYDVYANDFTPMTISSSSKTITIKTQEEIEASYSKDNDLKSLSVDGFELNQTFDKDILEYTVDVPEDTKEIKINASKNDSTASISGTGTFPVTSGTNTFEIVVRAQNGSEQTYKVVVNVIDKNPINIEIEGNTLSVVKIKEDLTVPDLYEEVTIKIDSYDIPAFYNKYLDYTLVGLKDTSGNIYLYIYDEEVNSYELYNEIKFSNLTIIPIKSEELLEGYEKFSESVNGVESEVYKLEKDSRYSVFYGKNVETGEEGFYKYDNVDNTLMKFDEEEHEEYTLLSQNMKLYTYIIFGFSGMFIILFIIIIVLIVKVNKRKVQNKNISKKEPTSKPVNKPVKEEVKEEIKEDKKTREEKPKEETNKKDAEEKEETNKKDSEEKEEEFAQL